MEVWKYRTKDLIVKMNHEEYDGFYKWVTAKGMKVKIVDRRPNRLFVRISPEVWKEFNGGK